MYKAKEQQLSCALKISIGSPSSKKCPLSGLLRLAGYIVYSVICDSLFFAGYLGLINLIVILSLSPIARYLARSLSLNVKEGGKAQTG